VRALRVKASDPSRKVIREAVRVLREGGIVAFATETVYGLAADAGNEKARAKLFAAKGRDPEKSCAYLLPTRESLTQHLPGLPPLAERLADAFWPGPVTLVVPMENGNLVGLRLPSETLPRVLAREAGTPLLQTSANRSGAPAALNAAAVAAALGDKVDLILDSGRSPGGRASSVVHCDDRQFRILRVGAVPESEILRAATDLYVVACTGNICRSPLGEALLRHEAARLLRCETDEVMNHGFRFASCGTMGLPGEPASAHSVTTGSELGVDLSDHRSRAVTGTLLREARVVYALARNHVNLLLPYVKDDPEKVQLLSPDGADIADPIGCSLRIYRRVARQISEACRTRMEEILAGDPRVTGIRA